MEPAEIGSDPTAERLGSEDLIGSGAVAAESSEAVAAESSDDAGRVSRRQLLRKAGIGGSVVLASTMMASPVLAQTPTPGPTSPDPSRTGRDPVAPSELATRAYVDTRVVRAGDTMTGALWFSSAEAAQRRIGTDAQTNQSFAIATAGVDRIVVAASGATEFSGPVTAASGVQVTGDLTVTGDAALNDLDVSGDATFDAAVAVKDKLTVKDLQVDGDAVFTAESSVRLQYPIPDDDDETLEDLAVSKAYVDDRVSSSRGGAGAQGGLFDAENGEFDEVFFENDVVIRADYTLGTRYDPKARTLVEDPETGLPVVLRKNAVTAGPVSILPSVVVTVPQGSVWTLV
jgi:hypothetical protein